MSKSNCWTTIGDFKINDPLFFESNQKATEIILDLIGKNRLRFGFYTKSISTIGATVDLEDLTLNTDDGIFPLDQLKIDDYTSFKLNPISTTTQQGSNQYKDAVAISDVDMFEKRELVLNNIDAYNFFIVRDQYSDGKYFTGNPIENFRKNTSKEEAELELSTYKGVVIIPLLKSIDPTKEELKIAGLSTYFTLDTKYSDTNIEETSFSNRAGGLLNLITARAIAEGRIIDPSELTPGIVNSLKETLTREFNNNKKWREKVHGEKPFIKVDIERISRGYDQYNISDKYSFSDILNGSDTGVYFTGDFSNPTIKDNKLGKNPGFIEFPNLKFRESDNTTGVVAGILPLSKSQTLQDIIIPIIDKAFSTNSVADANDVISILGLDRSIDKDTGIRFSEKYGFAYKYGKGKFINALNKNDLLYLYGLPVDTAKTKLGEVSKLQRVNVTERFLNALSNYADLSQTDINQLAKKTFFPIVAPHQINNNGSIMEDFVSFPLNRYMELRETPEISFSDTINTLYENIQKPEGVKLEIRNSGTSEFDPNKNDGKGLISIRQDTYTAATSVASKIVSARKELLEERIHAHTYYSIRDGLGNNEDIDTLILLYNEALAKYKRQNKNLDNEFLNYMFFRKRVVDDVTNTDLINLEEPYNKKNIVGRLTEFAGSPFSLKDRFEFLESISVDKNISFLKKISDVIVKLLSKVLGKAKPTVLSKLIEFNILYSSGNVKIKESLEEKKKESEDVDDAVDDIFGSSEDFITLDVDNNRDKSYISRSLDALFSEYLEKQKDVSVYFDTTPELIKEKIKSFLKESRNESDFIKEIISEKILKDSLSIWRNSSDLFKEIIQQENDTFVEKDLGIRLFKDESGDQKSIFNDLLPLLKNISSVLIKRVGGEIVRDSKGVPELYSTKKAFFTLYDELSNSSYKEIHDKLIKNKNNDTVLSSLARLIDVKPIDNTIDNENDYSKDILVELFNTFGTRVIRNLLKLKQFEDKNPKSFSLINEFSDLKESIKTNLVYQFGQINRDNKGNLKKLKSKLKEPKTLKEVHSEFIKLVTKSFGFKLSSSTIDIIKADDTKRFGIGLIQNLNKVLEAVDLTIDNPFKLKSLKVYTDLNRVNKLSTEQQELKNAFNNFEGILTWLVEQEIENSDVIKSQTKITPENKKKQAGGLYSSTDVMLKAFNNANTPFSYLFKEKTASPLTKATLMYEMKGRGYKVNMHDISGEENHVSKGKDTNNMNERDYSLMSIWTMLNRGLEEILRSETASSTFTLKVAKDDSNNQFNIYGRKQETLSGLQTRSISDYKNWIKGRFLKYYEAQQETVAQIQEYNEKYDTGLFLNKDGSVINDFIFSSNPIEGLRKTKGNEWFNKHQAKLEELSDIELLDKYMDSVVEDTINQVRDKFTELNIEYQDLNERGLEGTFEDLLVEYALSSKLYHLDSITIMYGGSHQLTKFYKRNKPFNSTGVQTISDKEFRNHPANKLKIGALYGNSVQSEWINTFIYNDVSVDKFQTVEDQHNNISSYDARKKGIKPLQKTWKALFGNINNWGKQIIQALANEEMSLTSKLHYITKFDPYANMDIADAQAFGTLDWAIYLLKSGGHINHKNRDIYDNFYKYEALYYQKYIHNNTAINTDIDTYRPLLEDEVLFMEQYEKQYPNGNPKVIIPIAKTQYAGLKRGSSDLVNELQIHQIDKMSLRTLIPSNVVKLANYNSNIETMKLLFEMHKNNVSYGKYQSASKLTKSTKGIYSAIDNVNDISTAMYQQHLDFHKEQIKTSFKTKKKTIFTSQGRALILQDISSKIKNLTSHLSNLRSDYKKGVSDLSEFKKQKLLSELGFDFNTNEGKLITDSIELVDYSVLLDKLAEVSKQRDTSRVVQEFIDLNREELENNDVLKIDFQDTVAKQALTSLIVGLINKTIVYQKVTGSQLVQASDAGYNNPTSVLSKSELGFYQKQLKTYDYNGTSVRAAESMISMSSHFEYLLKDSEVVKRAKQDNIGTLDALNKLLEEGKIDTKAITYFAWRTPNQGLASMEVFTVKQFLPYSEGSTIVVPKEIVAKAGSDFDIDKLSVMFYSPISDEISVNVQLDINYIRELKKDLKSKLIDFKESLSALEVIEKTDDVDFSYKLYIDTFTELEKLRKKLLKTNDTDKYLEISGEIRANELVLTSPMKVLEENAPELLASLTPLLENNDALKQLENEIFRTKRLIDNTEKTLENNLLETINDIVLHPKNFLQLVTPLTDYTLADNAADIMRLRGQVLDIEKSTDLDKHQLSSKKESSLKREALILLKKMLGVDAVANKLWQVYQDADIEVFEGVFQDLQYLLTEEELEEIKGTSGDLLSFKNPYSFKNTMVIDENGDARFEEDGTREFKSEINNQGVSSKVDGATNPYPYFINLRTQNAGLYAMLGMIGIVQRRDYLFNQPIITELIAEKAKLKKGANNRYKQKLKDDYSVKIFDLAEELGYPLLYREGKISLYLENKKIDKSVFKTYNVDTKVNNTMFLRDSIIIGEDFKRTNKTFNLDKQQLLDYYLNQLLALEVYEGLNKTSGLLFDTQQWINPDTNTVKSPYEILSKQKFKISEVLSTDTISNIENNSVISSFFDTRDILNGVLSSIFKTQYHPTVKDLYVTISDALKLDNKLLTENFDRVFSNDILEFFIIQNDTVTIDDTNKLIRDIVIKIQKESTKTSNGDEYWDRLWMDHTGKKLINVIKKRLPTNDQALLDLNIDDILKLSKKDLLIFARHLFYQQGFNRTPTSTHELLPPSVTVEFMNSSIKEFEENGTLPEFLDLFKDQFYKKRNEFLRVPKRYTRGKLKGQVIYNRKKEVVFKKIDGQFIRRPKHDADTLMDNIYTKVNPGTVISTKESFESSEQFEYDIRIKEIRTIKGVKNKLEVYSEDEILASTMYTVLPTKIVLNDIDGDINLAFDKLAELFPEKFIQDSLVYDKINRYNIDQISSKVKETISENIVKEGTKLREETDSSIKESFMGIEISNNDKNEIKECLVPVK